MGDVSSLKNGNFKNLFLIFLLIKESQQGFEIFEHLNSFFK